MFRRFSLILPGLLLLLVFINGSIQAFQNAAVELSSQTIQLKNLTFDPLTDERITTQNTDSLAQGQALYLIQFSGPVHEDWKTELSTLGVKFYDYIPDFTFITRLDAEMAALVRTYDFVRWVGEYQPQYRLSADLAVLQGEKEIAQTIVIQTLPDADLDAIGQQIQKWGGTVEDQSQNVFFGTIEATLAAQRQMDLAVLPEVIFIEPKLPVELTNDQGGTGIMNIGEVRQELGLFGQGQIVAVADSGLDTGNVNTLHPDVAGRLLYSIALGRIGVWSDPNGHGTHVAGSVLGNGVSSGSNPASHNYNNSYAGSAPEAQLIMQSIMDSNGGLGGIPADTGDLMRQAYDLGARVQTNSWGGPTGGTVSSPTYGAYVTSSQQVDAAAWEMKDLTILFAAGNEGTDANANGIVDRDKIGQPGTAKNCITVGATENLRPTLPMFWGIGWSSDFSQSPIASDQVANNSSGMAAFSSRGPTDDGRIKPDVVAPGTFIASMRSSIGDVNYSWGTLSYWGVTSSGSTLDQRYIFNGGTSQATPLVAGAAALIREWLVEVKDFVQPSSAMIKALLVHGADDISPGQYGTGTIQEIPSVSPNNVSGWGRVDVANSLITESNTPLILDDHTSGITTGQTVTYTINVGQSADTSNHTAQVPSEASTPLTVAEPSSQINSVTEQMLKNPSFETVSDWVLSQRGSYYASSYTHSGSKSIELISLSKGSAYQLVDIPSDVSDLELSFYWLNKNYDYPYYYTRACLSTPTLSSNYLCTGFLYSAGTAWQKTTLDLSGILNNVRGKQVAVYFYTGVFGSHIGWGADFYIDDALLNITTENGVPTATPTPTITPTPVPTQTPTPAPTPVPGTLGSLQASLVWTDYPGSTSAAKALVNDLDLVITAPDGTQYYGNSGAYAVGHSCLNNGHDRCNNTETILISDAVQGQYTITVTGYNVPQGGGQPYAIVITADQPLFAGDNFLYLPLLTR